MLYKRNLCTGQEDLEKEKQMLKQYFEDVNHNEMMVASLYMKIASDRQTEYVAFETYAL